jgi:predicted nicotinamide N-methyase
VIVPPPPSTAELEAFLDAFAPFQPVCELPDIHAFTARSLVEVWEAAERIAGCVLPSPFWAFPWPGGIALARVIIESPSLVQGRTVIDVGAGGGVTSFACAKAGATRIVACDSDPWALALCGIGASRQRLCIETVQADITTDPTLLDAYDVVVCGDLAYDRSAADLERDALRRAHERGATVLLADGGRTYFDADGLERLAEWIIPVVRDLEGVDTRTARVYRMVR